MLIFPIIIIFSLIYGLVVSGNLFLWIVVPSVIFEQDFESWAYNFSNNIPVNIVFVLIFWFVIGSLIGKFVGINTQHA